MNPAFKRFKLVEDDDEARQQREKVKQVKEYNPELIGEVRKQSNISDLIQDSNLPAEVKLMMLRMLHHTVKPISQTYKPETTPKSLTVAFSQPGFQTEIPLAAAPAIPVQAIQAQQQQLVPAQIQQVQQPGQAVAMAADEGEIISLNEIAKTMPRTFQEKAAELARMLSSHPERIRVNENYELIIDGERIANSNANNMFRFMYGAQRGEHPLGFAKFIGLLAKLQIPLNTISNKSVQSYLKDAYQVGSGKSKPKVIGYAKRPIIPAKPKSTKKRTFPSKSLSKSLVPLKLYKVSRP